MTAAIALSISRIFQTLCIAGIIFVVGTASVDALRSISSSTGQCGKVAPIVDDDLNLPALPQSLQRHHQRYRCGTHEMIKAEDIQSRSDSKLLNQPGTGVDAAATARRLLHRGSGSSFNMLPRGTVFSPPGPSRGGNMVGSPPALRRRTL